MRLLSVLLLLAASAQGQPTVGDQVIWRTTASGSTYRPAPQAARVAADGSGFVVAWSEFDSDGMSHAYAGRLDASGNLAAIGVRTAGTADAPSVVPSGDRYLAAWLEPDGAGTVPHVTTAALDRDFNVLRTRNLGVALGTPVVRVTPLRRYVGAGGALHEIDADGIPINTFFVGATIDDVAAGQNEVGYVVHSLTHPPKICGFSACFQPPDTYSLVFTWLFHVTLGDTWQFSSDAPAAIGANGDEFLYVYFDAALRQVKGMMWGAHTALLVLSDRGPTSLDSMTQPQIAWDGARWLVVWSTNAGIQGVAIARDQSLAPIAISSRGGRPAVAAARPGRFLITYEIVDFAGRRLASRIIDFGSPRVRVVR